MRTSASLASGRWSFYGRAWLVQSGTIPPTPQRISLSASPADRTCGHGTCDGSLDTITITGRSRGRATALSPGGWRKSAGTRLHATYTLARSQ